VEKPGLSGNLYQVKAITPPTLPFTKALDVGIETKKLDSFYSLE
jgi:hypothetical protein